MAAVVAAGSILAGLEATNLLGETLPNFCYALAAGFVLLAILTLVWWLVVSELVRGDDPHRHGVRRRLAWLVGCLVLLAGARFLFGESERGVRVIERVGEHGSLPAPANYFVLGLLAVTAIAFGVLRLRRWRQESADPPVLHPAVVGFVAVWLAAWLMFGPVGEWLGSGHAPAAYPASSLGDQSAIFATTGMVSSILENGPSFMQNTRELYLLYATLAVRMTHLGWWLVVACAALWALLMRRPAWTARFTRMDLEGEDRRAVPECWLTATMWSCLWLGLASLVLHGWCTLALGFCVDRMIALG